MSANEKLTVHFSARYFFTGLFVVWLALTCQHFYPSELPFLESQFLSISALMLSALAAGVYSSCDTKSDTRKTTGLATLRPNLMWLACAVIVNLLFQSAAHDLAARVISDRSVVFYGGITLTAVVLIATGTVFFKLGQRMRPDSQEKFETMELLLSSAAGGAVGITIFCLLMLRDPGPWSLIPLLLFLPSRPRLPIVTLVMLITAYSFSGLLNFEYSPYQKLEVRKSATGDAIVLSNGIPCLFYGADITKEDSDNELASILHKQSDVDSFKQYFKTLRGLKIPLAIRKYLVGNADEKALGDVLILGAGVGNETGFAIRNGARSVDAVEADPVLARLLRARTEPISKASKLSVYNCDPRNYLSTTDKQYDLIEFCHSAQSRSSQAPYTVGRDSLEYTVECLNSALKRLRPNGFVFLSFLQTPDSNLSSNLLYATACAIKNTPALVYRETDAERGPDQQCLSFYLFGDSLKKLRSNNNIAPVFVQFDELTGSEELPEGARAATDNWPFLRVNTDNFWIWMAFPILALMFCLYQGRKNSSQGGLCFKTIGLMAALFLANLILESALSLSFGTSWLWSKIALLIDCICLALALIVGMTRRHSFGNSWILYLTAVTMSILLLTPLSATTMSGAAVVLILATSIGLVSQKDFEVLVFNSIIGLISASIFASLVLYFGLRSSAVVAVVTLLVSYLSNQRQASSIK